MTWINQNTEIYYLHCYMHLNMELLSEGGGRWVI